MTKSVKYNNKLNIARTSLKEKNTMKRSRMKNLFSSILNPIKKYRVIGSTRQVREDHGYVGFQSIFENLLQVGIGPFWFTLDREEVPSHVLISRGALGQNNSGWTSKFKSYM